MNIGLTYDLRDDYIKMGYTEEETAEFDRSYTIDSIENTLKSLGYKTDRIGHSRNLIKRLANGEKWDMVFNIAEGMYGIGREALIPALLESYRIPYTFSDSLVLALTLHKGMTKHVIRDQKIPTPDFFVLDSMEQLKEVNLIYPLFAKPVAEGTSKGVTSKSKVSSKEELSLICSELLEKFNQPVLIEEFLPGREFTVGIIGTGDNARVVGVMEVILKDNAESHAYTYLNKENCEELVVYEIPNDEIAKMSGETALRAWKAIGCRDSGRVDIKLDRNGIPNFIEVNPLAGLHPEHSDLPIICTKVGISFMELIDSIMKSALKRYNLL